MCVCVIERERERESMRVCVIERERLTVSIVCGNWGQDIQDMVCSSLLVWRRG